MGNSDHGTTYMREGGDPNVLCVEAMHARFDAFEGARGRDGDRARTSHKAVYKGIP